MVPLDQAALPGLDKMAPDYVGSIVTLDVHSPEFAKKAESIRTMGDDDIRAAAAVSNRMLDTPVRASRRGFDAGSDVSNTLLELRRHRGSRPRKGVGRTQAARHHPVRRQAPRLLPPLRERADAHQRDPERALPRSGRAAQGQRRSRAGEDASLGDDATADAVRLRRRAPRRRPDGEDRRDRGNRPRTCQGAQGRRAVLRATEAPGSPDAACSVDPGLPGDRSHTEEQHRADQGRRPRDDHDDLRVCARL